MSDFVLRNKMGFFGLFKGLFSETLNTSLPFLDVLFEDKLLFFLNFGCVQCRHGLYGMKKIVHSA